MRTLCLLLAAALRAAAAGACVPPVVEPAGPGSKPLVEFRTRSFTVAWVDSAKAVVRFSTGEPALVSFERIAPADREACPAQSRVPIPDWLGGRVFLHVSPRGDARPFTGQGLAGIQTAQRLVLFPREGDHPRTISFEIEGAGAVDCLITGLSMGTWEIWWNGGLVDPDLPAGPGGTLSFKAAAGGYFLRRR